MARINVKPLICFEHSFLDAALKELVVLNAGGNEQEVELDLRFSKAKKGHSGQTNNFTVHMLFDSTIS